MISFHFWSLWLRDRYRAHRAVFQLLGWIYIAGTTGFTFAAIQATVHHDTLLVTRSAYLRVLARIERRHAERAEMRLLHLRRLAELRRLRRVRILATAYDIDPHREPGAPCTRFPHDTATGVQVHVGSIAVDPRVFPLGTRFYVPGYGSGVADDTGGLIRGRHIDLAIDGCGKALRWGARHLVADVIYPH